MYNPFDPRIKRGELPLMNPFTFEVKNGLIKDGEIISYHIMTGQTWKKTIVEGGEVVRAFNYDLEDNEWIEIPKPWGTGEGENY